MTSKVTSAPFLHGWFPAVLRLLPSGGSFVLALSVEFFDDKSSTVGPDVGEAPADALVVSDDDEGNAGQSDSGDIEADGCGLSGRGFQMRGEPELGIWWSRCMSFERSGFPDTVCCPETTQLFDPGRKDRVHSWVKADFSRALRIDFREMPAAAKRSRVTKGTRVGDLAAALK